MRVTKRVLWITAVAVAIAVAIVAWLIVTSEPVAAQSQQIVVPAPTPGLGDAELEAVVAYIRAVQKANGIF